MALLVVPVSADYDSYSYYEFDPVVSEDIGDMSLLSMGTRALASGDSGVSTMSLTSNESQWLHDIRNALISYSGGAAENSVLGTLVDIEYYVSLMQPYMSNLSLLSDITSSADSLYKYVQQYYPDLDYNLQSISTMFSRAFADISYSMGYYDENGNFVHTWSLGPTRPFDMLGYATVSLAVDGVNSVTGRTLYSRIKQLQEVLASDDDLALANSQKDNREEIEDSFLSGSSGATSLGKSDFGALSDIGGTVKETISLNGQSSVGNFTSGLTGADTAGQGWFSESTKDALDSVSSSASYDLRSDPYNMAGWQERYAWVEGE